MKNWYKLDVSVKNAIREDHIYVDDIKNENFNAPGIGFIRDMSTQEEFEGFFHKGWLDYMKHKGLEFDSVLVFYRQPRSTSPMPHADSKRSGTKLYYALNWVELDNDTSAMQWFEHIGEEVYDFGFNPAGGGALFCPPENLREIDRQNLGKELTLVRTDLCHDIDMSECDDYRLSISIRFRGDRFPDITDWASAVEHFKPLIKDDDV